MLQLFVNHQRLVSILKEKPHGTGGGGGGKRGRPAGGATAGTSRAGGGGGSVGKAHKSLLSLRFVTLMLKALFR